MSEILRVNIAENWSVGEMSDFLLSVETIYNMKLYTIAKNNNAGFYQIIASLAPPYKLLELDSFNDEIFSSRHHYLVTEGALKIHRMKLESPGFQDFTGVGEAIKQVRLLIEFLCKYYSKEEKEKRTLENSKTRIDIQRDFVKLRTESAVANAVEKYNEEILIVHMLRLGRKIEEGKITSVESIDTDKDDPSDTASEKS